MKKLILVFILIILLNGCSFIEDKDCIKAKRVIDGDTIELDNGETVRLIGIDAPERGKKGYEDSADYLDSLISYKCLYLEKDVSDKDKYNRSLRYVFVNFNQSNEVFVNLRMVQDGYAAAFSYEPDVKYRELFNVTEGLSKNRNI